MKLLNSIKKKIVRYFFNHKWRCNVCGKEIFGQENFCKECQDSLPYNDYNICNHCGRKVNQPMEYCSTCKNNLTAIDLGRSVFDYSGDIVTLIHKAKYRGDRYLLKVFADEMELVYYKNYFTADFITFVPMTKRAKKKRGYNQSQLLATALGERVNVEIMDCVEKIKDTDRQATLNAKARSRNLADAFRVKDKKIVKGKRILIVDDVTTTGATLSSIATNLKKAGANKVFYLTVASVGPKKGY